MNTTWYRYDGLDNLLNITDNEGNKFRFEFDSLGRRTGLRDPDLGNWSFGYDAVGNLVNQTDARATTLRFEYDNLNRLTKKDYPSDTDVVLSYDSGVVGVLSQANSSSGTVRYDYDRRMRLTAENYTRGSSSWKITHGYDALDRQVNTSFSNGEVLNYTYNSGGMLESVPGYVSGLDYTALGKVSNRTYNNGVVSNLDYYSDSFRLKSFKTGVIQNLSYSYDSVGNILTMNDYSANSLWAYGYDPLDRLTSANESGGVSQSFSYSSIGNIISHNNGSNVFNYTYGIGAGPHAATSYNYSGYTYVYGGYNVTASCTGVSPSSGSDWNITSNTSCSNGVVRLSENRTVYVAPNKSLSLDNGTLEPTKFPGTFILLDAGSVLEGGASTTVYGDDKPNQEFGGTLTTGFLYDANGNMVNDSRFTYVYNDDSRMLKVMNGSSVVEEYLYDHGGSRKVKLTVISPSLNKTTYYLSKEWIREEYTNGTSANTFYIYATNELLARKDSAGNKHYYHPDHLGSTTVISNQSGQLEERISYFPYGQPRQNSKEMYQFTNQEWEPNIGIFDYDARQYNPILMRFMQADTIKQNYFDPQLLNSYSYSRNSPIKYLDTSGYEVTASRNEQGTFQVFVDGMYYGDITQGYEYRPSDSMCPGSKSIYDYKIRTSSNYGLKADLSNPPTSSPTRTERDVMMRDLIMFNQKDFTRQEVKDQGLNELKVGLSLVGYYYFKAGVRYTPRIVKVVERIDKGLTYRDIVMELSGGDILNAAKDGYSLTSPIAGVEVSVYDVGTYKSHGLTPYQRIDDYTQPYEQQWYYDQKYANSGSCYQSGYTRESLPWYLGGEKNIISPQPEVA